MMCRGKWPEKVLLRLKRTKIWIADVSKSWDSNLIVSVKRISFEKEMEKLSCHFGYYSGVLEEFQTKGML